MPHLVADIVITLAAVVAGLGLIYRMVLRPLSRLIHREIALNVWIRDQFEARNGEGRLRDQVDRIEEQVNTNTDRFAVLQESADRNATEIANLRLQVSQVQQVTKSTAATVDHVHETITEAVTGEIPVTPTTKET